MKRPRSPWRKKLMKALKWIGICLAAILVLALGTVLITRAVKAAQTKINTENGIQESAYVELNGIRQFVQIRGEDKENPVILMLHGGPGSPIAFLSSYYQRALERDYTLVNVDQRGSGRTYYANLGQNIPLSMRDILSDIDALVDYLRERFGQAKIILLGHSWGTMLGSIYVKEHPEKVAAYIGVGQSVNSVGGETFRANEAVRRAQANGDDTAAQKLSALSGQYSGFKEGSKEAFLMAMELRGASASYFRYEGEISTPQTIWLGLSSPDMDINDMRWFLALNGSLEHFLALEEPLLEDCMTFRLDELGSEYTVPVYYISGENDWITPVALVEEYYQTVQAPKKGMIILPNAGHSPFLDDPEAFCAAVANALQK